MMALKRGQRIVVEAHGGPRQVVVVEDRGDIVLVTREAEFRQAQQQARDPLFVGFRRKDIVQVSPIDDCPAGDVPMEAFR